MRKKAAKPAAAPKKKKAGNPRNDARGGDSTAFPVVGVGASAGGVQAFKELIRSLPQKPGLAIVFVLHTDRHDSALVDVLSRVTDIPVSFVTNRTKIERDHIYVSHPDSEVSIADGALRVDRKRDGVSLPVDLLLGTLAEDQRSRAVAVILSGSASDGAQGTKAVRAEGGITFAQDQSAQFSGMPRAAGAVDFVMPPDEIARELVQIAQHAAAETVAGRIEDEQLGEIFTILQGAHDVDFTNYKGSTIERRIRRRMSLHRMEDLGEYIRLLREDGKEVEQLYGDLLIRVTSFFRDPEVFEALQRDVVPALMKERTDDSPIRVWVPGCSTGEEVYSLAICLLELMSDHGWNCPIQIFGTDVNDSAIEEARTGLYAESISAHVSPERLHRFFTKADGGYRVSKTVRDCCVFARQNLTQDPPFSRLDLISCRNVMIYLGSVLQRRALAIFHYALRQNGYLLLGSSETIGNFADLFTVVDRKHRIYQRKSVARLPVEFEAAIPRIRNEAARGREEVAIGTNVFREADRVLLSRFSPPGVLIDDNMEILQFRGRTSLYLEPAPGTASFNILKMAREGLLPELRTAIHAARKKETPVRRDRVRMKSNGAAHEVSIEVVPFIGSARDRYFIVLFEEVSVPPEEAAPAKKKRRGEDPRDTRQAAHLRRELDTTREYLQSIIEEQEAMNEELRSANEEVQSSNEELQSTNEELETAKEELQSSNEELTTLNEELETRAAELTELNNDLTNLLASVDIPIVMLDSTLRIRRFNPGAQRTLKLIPGDVGRQITDLKSTLMLDDFETVITDVIDNLEVKEMEVQDRNGRWFALRVRPYKTVDHKIDGAVLTLVDIDQIRRRNNG